MTRRIRERVRQKVSTMAVAVAVLLAGSVVASATSHAAPTFNPALVSDEFVAGGMPQALAADWLPDGRMVVLTKPGSLYIVNPTTGTKSLLYALPDVDARGESGALDVVVDLSFATNSTIYVYYSALSDARLRIAKLVLDATVSSIVSNTTIWSNPGPLRTQYADPTNHIGGSLDIGPDGKFYLSIGDALASLSQDLTNVFGKILRINLDGSVPSDNPVISGKTIGEIWAYGLRNPYRSQFERSRTTSNPMGAPATPYWIGDVGGNVAETAYEEVNVGQAGANYGWPLCEGPVGMPKNGVVCPNGVTAPALAYPHTTGVACCFNKAVIGGQMYRTGNFPFAGYYIFGDYPSSTISWMQLDSSGQVSNDSGLIRKLQTAGQDEAPVWIDISPDGNIYFLDIFHASLRRLTYSGGTVNSPPVIQTASATPTNGLAPLTVSFTGQASDSEGDPITYLWNFGDGTTSASQSPTHVYGSQGTYEALLQVTAGGVTVNSNPVTIKVGKPPTVAITSPPNGFVFTAGRTITATGVATDGANNAIPPAQLEWTVVFRHDNHTHPELSQAIGSSVSFAVPTSGHDFSGNTGYRISLKATDSSGLSSTTSIDVNPTKIAVPVTANVPTSAVLSGITQALPFTIDTVPGFRHTVEVPQSVCVAGVTQHFASWSDGGARSHTVSASAGMALVATYAPASDRCESKFVPLSPERIFDTRNGATKPDANDVLNVKVVGKGGIPLTGASAVVVNVTAVNAADAGFVTVWPTGLALPTSSNINVRAGETAPNLVTVSPGLDGSISILVTASVHIVVDVFGYFVPTDASVDGRFVPLSSPQRLYDTRDLGPTPGPESQRTVIAAGMVGIPASGAEAVVLNVTATDALAPGFVTVWPAGGAVPQVSNINLDHAGQTRPNQVIVRLGDAGAFSLYTSGGSHFVVDVVGYFTATGSAVAASKSGLFVPVSPARLLDTRNQAKPAAGSRTDLILAGRSEVPSSGVLALVANTTEVDAVEAGFVTVYPSGQAVPLTSNLNAEAGQTIANQVTSLVEGGGVSLRTTSEAHLIMDLAGWYLA